MIIIFLKYLHSMNDNIIFRGVWWLPNKPDEKVYGALIQTQFKNELLLETEDYGVRTIENYFDEKLKTNNIFLGESLHRQKITLMNVVAQYSSCYFPYAKGRFFIEYVFFGEHFKTPEDIKFKQIKTQYNHLPEWLNINGFKLNFGEEKNIFCRLEYKIPKEIKIKLNEKTTLKFSFGVVGPTNYVVVNEQKITQDTFVMFECVEKYNFKTYLHLNKVFRDFLTLATQKHTQIENIVGIIETKLVSKIVTFNIPKEIKIITRLNPIKKNTTSEILHFEMLFSFKDIEEDYESIIKNWFENYSKLGLLIHSYFEFIYNPDNNLEYTFLALIHALEGYHRVNYGGCYYGKKKYADEILPLLKKSIPENLAEGHKEALKSKLNYGYEYSLIKRLNDILTDYSTILDKKDTKKIKKHIPIIVDIRNYYVHQDTTTFHGTPKAKDVLKYTLLLKRIIEYSFFRNMGLNSEKIKKLMENYYSNHKLKNWHEVS